jgi:hypothetical protein
MNLLKLMVSLIEEHDCSTTVNDQRNYITFKKNGGLRTISGTLDYHRLSIKDTKARIMRVRMESKGNNGRPFFIPDQKVLLSVDLHDPRSLKTIRDWLKTLR